MELGARRGRFVLDPLIAEAKRRMRRRRGGLLVAVLATTAGAVALTLALRPPPHASSTRISFQRGGLSVVAPQGLWHTDIKGGVWPGPAFLGMVLANYPANSFSAEKGGSPMNNFADATQAPPANHVVLYFALWGVREPGQTINLHLPLTLAQPWNRQQFANGAAGYRWGFLRAKGRIYEVFFWSGSAAPARDRSAILDALISLRLPR